MLLTDDVYGTFVDDFRSLLGELPHNTIGVYSYSKYFGCTGWRLGVIAIHEDNIFDKMIAKLPEADVKALDKRYSPITLEPRKLKFIDRIVADSRDVGLNHTAGLSLPQQVMMTMFSLSEMMDTKKEYQKACMEIVHRRAQAMIDSMALKLAPNPNYDAYYGLIDFEFWARKNIGDEAVEYLKKNIHPLDLAFRLAEDPRHRAAERRRVRGSRMVAARVAGEPARRGIRGHRSRRSSHRARLPRRVRSVEDRAKAMNTTSRFRSRASSTRCRGTLSPHSLTAQGSAGSWRWWAQD